MERRPQPVKHLDAHTATVERALIARAEALLAEAEADANTVAQMVKAAVGSALLDVAQELHYW